MVIPIAIVGDLPPDNRFHAMTTDSLHHAAVALDIAVETKWIGTDELAQGNLTHADVQRQLANFRGIWIAPGSPYKNMDAALATIRFARENQVPLLGTCGGFQHIILEYARNVLGFAEASHAESDPYASVLFISRLACSLVGRTMTISLVPDSLLSKAYGKTPVQEGYYCNFGVNPDYIDVLRSGKLRVVASDVEGEVRAVELIDHLFFVGTLFIPQMKSTADQPHPLIVSFLKATAAAQKPTNSIERIETKRLIGRRIRPDDFDLFRQLHQNHQVAVTMGFRSDGEIHEMIDRHVDHWSQHGFGLWIWYSRGTDNFVGRGGMHNVFVGGHHEIEIGYALMPEFWNQGLATEIARASIDVAFNQLDLAEIVAFTLPTNLASRRVMEKCGFTFERDIVWKDLPHVLYRLKR